MVDLLIGFKFHILSFGVWSRYLTAELGICVFWNFELAFFWCLGFDIYLIRDAGRS